MSTTKKSSGQDSAEISRTLRALQNGEITAAEANRLAREYAVLGRDIDRAMRRGPLAAGPLKVTRRPKSKPAK